MQEITPTALLQRLSADQPPLLLDVREPWEVDICSLTDSVNVPMGRIPEAAAGLDGDRDIVVVCHHGVRSAHVAMYLERSGFTNIYNLLGGIDAWAREVDPDMPVY